MWYLALSILFPASRAFQSSIPEHHYNLDSNNDACPSNSLLYNQCCQSKLIEQNSLTFRHNKTQKLYNSAQAQSLPWSHYPECYTNGNATSAICSFSHHDFANGRGVSMVTTSADAYSIISSPAFTDPDVHDGVNSYDSPPYVEVQLPGRGRGLIANKTLHRGDLIFSSTPILIMNPDAYDLDEEERLKLGKRAVETLPKSARREFWGLLGHFGTDEVDDRITTNAFEVEINGRTRYVVLPEIARMNHDCRPNAAYFFDPETLQQHVHATTEIPLGAEITISYINYELPRADRLVALETSWGFRCSCSACSAHYTLTSSSDARLREVPNIENELGDWTEESSATPEMALYLISIYEQERLWASLADGYRWAALAYSAIGERWSAVRYARLAFDMGVLDKGWNHKKVEEMRELAADPEMSWSWRKRVKGGCGCGQGHRH